MKKILIVIHNMKIGGAQKSLLSFLQSLTDARQTETVDVHLMVVDPKGAFFPEIPKDIQFVDAPKELRLLSVPMSRKLLLACLSCRSIVGEILWIWRKVMKRLAPSLHITQQKWTNWKQFVPENEQKYDVAISYMDGCPNYYVIDKVKADKKVLWVHSEYRQQGYDPTFDRPYFEESDVIVTISDRCAQCLQERFPQCESKIYILENITSYKTVAQKSKEGSCPEFADTKELKLLTVGRLHPQKGIDLAIGAAKYLKEAGVAFRWLVVGDGAERQVLQERIDAFGLSDCVYLLGSRENPYTYMAECDILVQPSRVEGKSIVLDEAKMLCKPIVATNYATVKDALMHGETGWIVDMTEQGICEGILHLHQHLQLREKMMQNLEKLPKSNEDELERYINIMF